MSKILLSDIAEINPKGWSPSVGESVSFVSMSDVKALDGSISESDPLPAEEAAKGYTKFLRGDILVAKITPCFENKKIAQAEISRLYGAGSTEFHVVRPKEGLADARFLLHFLRRKEVLIRGESKMTGSSGHRRVPESFLSQIEVPNISLGEQTRIGELLDEVEFLSAKRRESIRLLEDLPPALFSEMFGDVTRDPDGVLGDVAQEVRYGTSRKSEKSGTPVLRIPNVVQGRMDFSDLKKVPISSVELDRLRLNEGDLLFVRTNGNPEYVGRCSVFDKVPDDLQKAFGEDFVYASYLIRIRLDLERVEPIYIRELMRTSGVIAFLRRNSKTSAGQYNLNSKGLRSVPIRIPPLAIQQEFADRVRKIEDAMAVREAHLAYLDELFASVQQRAFRGDLWADSAA